MQEPSEFSPLLTVAPMEGLTAVTFRQVHHRFFGGVDRYFIPFVSPTVIPKFTERHLRELAPQVNAGFHAVPQLLTRRSDDFIWAAKALADMGYDEVNLNLGCPAGTVVAKGKGSGFLREPTELYYFLDRLFQADLPIAVSVKTRLGWSDETQFASLLDIYNRFPIHCLTIHPRVKKDLYRGDVRLEALDRYAGQIQVPWAYNGDLVTPDDVRKMSARYGHAQAFMIGRGVMADPALFRKLKGGTAATREEIQAFSQTLFESYAQAFDSWNNALMRMKEYWFYQLNLFEEADKLGKALFKAKNAQAFNEALKPIFQTCALRENARYGWRKPA